MEVIKTMRPGQPGTRKLQEKYGNSLVAVRYRTDASQAKQFTTVELVVDQRDILPAYTPHSVLGNVVAVKIQFHEKELRERVKAAGGRWDTEQKLWWLAYAKVVELGVEDRLEVGVACADMDIR